MAKRSLDDWDDPLHTVNVLDPILDKARTLARKEAMIERLKAETETLRKELAIQFPAGIGTHKIIIDRTTILLKRPERWKWNRQMIHDLLSAKAKTAVIAEIDEAVLRHIHLARTTFEKLSEPAQAVLKPALTLVDGPVSIEVLESEEM